MFCVFVQLEEELRSTSARADTMNGVVAALPSDESDTVRMRAYNWQDVQDLQEVPLLYRKKLPLLGGVLIIVHGFRLGS